MLYITLCRLQVVASESHPPHSLRSVMATLTVPTMNLPPPIDSFNIEPTQEPLPPLPESLQLPQIIHEIDKLTADISTYTMPSIHDTISDSNTNNSTTNPVQSIPFDPTKYTNPGLAAAARKRLEKRKTKANRVNLCKTNNPMKPTPTSLRCPWQELGAKNKATSYVLYIKT